MQDIGTASGPLRRAAAHMLDGAHPWGAADVSADRFGVTRYRLVVYPPGIDRVDRRLVRLWRGWPVWGVLVWIGCEIWLTQIVGPWAALAISTTVALASGALAALLAGDQRAQVRTMAVTVLAGQYDEPSLALRSRIETLAGRLIDADERLRRRTIAPAEHEMAWWRVYDELAEDRATPRT